jgi:hypothetical protein
MTLKINLIFVFIKMDEKKKTDDKEIEAIKPRTYQVKNGSNKLFNRVSLSGKDLGLGYLFPNFSRVSVANFFVILLRKLPKRYAS